jgi:hypothetical protein
MMGILGACSTHRSHKIKSVQFKPARNAKSIGSKEFKECRWAFVAVPGSEYDGLEVDAIIRSQDPKVSRVENLSIAGSGFGMSGIGRFCMSAKGEFYAEN